MSRGIKEPIILFSDDFLEENYEYNIREIKRMLSKEDLQYIKKYALDSLSKEIVGYEIIENNIYSMMLNRALNGYDYLYINMSNYESLTNNIPDILKNLSKKGKTSRLLAILDKIKYVSDFLVKEKFFGEEIVRFICWKNEEDLFNFNNEIDKLESLKEVEKFVYEEDSKQLKQNTNYIFLNRK